MIERDHILISLEKRHAEGILSGRKTVELRRRAMRVLPGAVIWFYVKVPVASIVGYASISEVDESPPQALWERHGRFSGLSRSEFFSYFRGSQLGMALTIHEPSRLETVIPLHRLREASDRFHPPQFFTRLHETHPVRDAVVAAIGL